MSLTEKIINKYEKAKQLKRLTFLSNPMPKNIKKCLLSYCSKTNLTSPQENIIRIYLKDQKKEEFNQLISSSDTQDFKPMQNVLLGKVKNPSKHYLPQLLEIIVDFDIKISTPPEDQQFDEISAVFIKKYTKDTRYNSIRINADIDNTIGNLSMDNYYIQLSYIEHKNLSNRDSLSRAEKESSKTKIYNQNQVFSIGDLSQDYITEKLLSDQKVIISGNPGVGKSTFAKHLCYNWAKTSERQAVIPVYIRLRDLDFSQQHFISTYIKNTYFDTLKVSNEKWDSFFNNKKQYRLLLDGFDEIKLPDRIRLSENVFDNQYIVLSRPYGLLHHKLNYDASYQIDGFTNQNRDYYIESVIKAASKANKSSKTLIRLIEKNKTLTDYAHTPLMLSYIALIYITGASAEETLTTVKSTYDLQDKVYGWIWYHASQKPYNYIDTSSEMKNKMEKLAYDMQIHKKLIYKAHYDDLNTEVAKNLSAIGLGSQRALGNQNFSQWQFYFNTLTFQEYLAVKYIDSGQAGKLNHEALTYLITDSYFWNFTSQIVGMLSKKRNDVLLKKILEYLYKTSQKENHTYYKYSYYMLLSECYEPIVHDQIQTEALNQLVIYYKNSYFDEFWHGVVHDSVEKIVSKLPYKNQLGFVNYVVTEINRVVSNIQNGNTELENLFYLSGLIRISASYNPKALVQAIIHLSLQLKKNIEEVEKQIRKLESEEPDEDKAYEFWENQMDELYYFDHIYRNTQLNIFNDLELFESNFLLKHKASIELLYESELRTIPVLENIISKTTNILDIQNQIDYYNQKTDNLHSQLSRTELTLRNTKKKTKKLKKQVEQTQKNLFENYVYLTEKLYLNFIKMDSQNPVQQNRNILLLQSIIKILPTIEKWDTISEYEFGHIIDLCISSLVRIDEPSLYETLATLSHEYESTIFHKVTNRIAFRKYINRQFIKILKDRNLNKINKLVHLLRESYPKTIDFFVFREQLFELFKKLVEKNKSQLLQFDSDSSNELVDTLLRIARIPQKSFEKKFFIDKLISGILLHIPFIQNEILLKELSYNFIFYEERYWLIYTDYFQRESYDISVVLPTLTNEDLYKFESNHKYLTTIFLETFNKTDNIKPEILQDYGQDILNTIYHLLFVVKRYENTNKHKIINLIEKLLSSPELIELSKNKVVDLTNIEWILAYVFFEFFKPDTLQAFQGRDLYKEIHQEVGAESQIIESIIRFTENPYYGIEIQEIYKFKESLGEKMYHNLLNIIEQRLLNKNTYDADYFNMLLKTGSSI